MRSFVHWWDASLHIGNTFQKWEKLKKNRGVALVKDQWHTPEINSDNIQALLVSVSRGIFEGDQYFAKLLSFREPVQYYYIRVVSENCKHFEIMFIGAMKHMLLVFHKDLMERISHHWIWFFLPVCFD